MKNKTEALLDLLVGVLFVAVGVLLLLMNSEMTLVKIIAAIDLAFGAVLVIGGIVKIAKSAGKPAVDAADDWSDEAMQKSTAVDDEIWMQPVQDTQPEPVAETVQPEPAQTVDAEALSARENELRRLVKQRRAQAREAAENAERANAAASAAEQALVEAENEMKYASDDQKRAYLSRIDSLADDAMEKSQQAVFATRRAKLAERALNEAVEQHRQAMDAAAEAMMAAEEAEWNAR